MLVAIPAVAANGLLPCAQLCAKFPTTASAKSPDSTDMLACSLLLVPSGGLLIYYWKAALIAYELLDCPSRNVDGSLKKKVCTPGFYKKHGALAHENMPAWTRRLLATCSICDSHKVGS